MGKYRNKKNIKDNDEENKKNRRICTHLMENKECPYKGHCVYAHTMRELLEAQKKMKNYKSVACIDFFKKGYCKYGNRCSFDHKKKKKSKFFPKTKSNMKATTIANTIMLLGRSNISMNGLDKFCCS